MHVVLHLGPQQPLLIEGRIKIVEDFRQWERKLPHHGAPLRVCGVVVHRVKDRIFEKALEELPLQVKLVVVRDLE